MLSTGRGQRPHTSDWQRSPPSWGWFRFVNWAPILIKVGDITLNEVGRGSPGAQSCDRGDKSTFGRWGLRAAGGGLAVFVTHPLYTARYRIFISRGRWILCQIYITFTHLLSLFFHLCLLLVCLVRSFPLWRADLLLLGFQAALQGLTLCCGRAALHRGLVTSILP